MKHSLILSSCVVLVMSVCAGCPPTGKQTPTGAASSATTSSAAVMVVTRAGSQAPTKGPASSFTGDVSVVPLFAPNDARHSSAGSVTFSPGARSAWHTHPAGQTLIVTAGTGWVQEWGREKQEIKAGDVIWTPPGVKHWHGAIDHETMTHIATQELVNGQAVDWMEQVSDEQYRR